MNSQLFTVLADFSSPKPSEVALSALLKPSKPQPTAEVSAETRAKPKPDPAAELAEAVRRAVEVARAEEREMAVRDREAMLEAERARHTEELAAERILWAESEGAALSARFGAAFVALETLVCDRVANVLGPFVTASYREQMVSELRVTLKKIMAESAAKTVLVTGPEDLLAALKGGAGQDLGSIEFQVSDEIDVCVVASDTAVDSQLKPWTDRLNDVLKAV